ncbi:MAG: D-alanine--D-alanine ligase family protein [Myxococcota bacterium]|jgi:D-alanine-D-alanine ligase
MNDSMNSKPPSAPAIWPELGAAAQTATVEEAEEPPSGRGLRKSARGKSSPKTGALQLDWTRPTATIQAFDPSARRKKSSQNTGELPRKRKTRRLALVCNVKPDASSMPGPVDEYEEYDSPQTVAALAGLLGREGYIVTVLEADRSLPRKLAAGNFDMVFNIAEGKGGRCREAHVPALCEMLGIAYTGSDPLTLAATLDKDVAKRLVCREVHTPAWLTVRKIEDLRAFDLTFPVFAKPLDEGSSKGIRDNSRCKDFAELEALVSELLELYGRPVLVEEFIGGPEVTVGVVGNRDPEVIGMMHVVPTQGTVEDFIYSLEAKRDYENRVRYAIPPELPDATCRRIEAAALKCFQLLGCHDVARIDFRVGPDGHPYFIEANPLPGLSPTSGDIVLTAKAMGIPWETLIARIVREAEFRQGVLRPTLVPKAEAKRKNHLQLAPTLPLFDALPVQG